MKIFLGDCGFSGQKRGFCDCRSSFFAPAARKVLQNGSKKEVWRAVWRAMADRLPGSLQQELLRTMKPTKRRFMSSFHAVAIPTEVADSVRATMKSPKYGFPAHKEVVAGRAPCRHCLQLVKIHEEEAILFTMDAFPED